MTADFFFGPGFNLIIKNHIMANQFSDASWGCYFESLRWADKLMKHDEELSIELREGMYSLDSGEQEGHTWLVVDGRIFDPTAGQFEDMPDTDKYDEVHIITEGEDLTELLAEHLS